MRGVLAAFAIAAALALATGVSYADPSGHTSEEQTLGSGAPIFPGSSFETVAEGPGQPRVFARCRGRRRRPGGKRGARSATSRS